MLFSILACVFGGTMRNREFIIYEDYDSLSKAVALRMAEFVRTNPQSLLCLAAGETPLGALRALVALQSENKVDLRTCWYVGLDEWLGLGYGDPGSCAQIMQDIFYGPAGIPSDHLSVFDGLDEDTDFQTKKAFDFIKARGGISLALLGIGMNGHLGFNEPGTTVDFPGGTIDLDETTRTVGKKYFAKPFPLDKGITIGLKHLLAAKRILLMANGEKKAGIVETCMRESPDPSRPASFLQDHPGFELYLDKGAASRLLDRNQE